MVNGEKVEMTDEEIALMEQEHAARATEKPRQDVQRQILILESAITPRRLREAVLDIDNGWLENQENLINQQRNLL